MSKHYVVYTVYHYQDCTEDRAEIASSLERALELVEERGKPTRSCMTSVQLFELGVEIPIEKIEVKVPQPPIVTTKFRVKQTIKCSICGNSITGRLCYQQAGGNSFPIHEECQIVIESRTL